jgi:ribosomal-protein-alanine N-acetyltransferase
MSTSDEVVIREGRPADLAEITVMADSSSYWPDEKFQEIFNTPRTLLVADHNGALLGFILAHNILGEWEIESIAVAPGHRHRGIGRMLVQALIDAAITNKAQFIFLEVRESNLAARGLYESCGFRQYSRRKAYYSNPDEDALLYRFLCTPETRENC